MRQGFIAAAAFAAGLSLLSPANAATKSHSASAAGPKIAVVDLQQAVARSQRGSEAAKLLKQKQDDLQAQATDLADKRKALKDQLDKADAKSSNYATLQKQYQDADQAFQAYVTDARQLLQQRQAELLQPIQDELQTVVPQFVKDQHIDILLVRGAGVLTASEAYDKTAELTAAMDKDWAQMQKAQATAPATPAPAAGTKH
ncbi:MAG TPA: OmpH family outer membrane protein [Gammaproteobacteria bacterium]|nr:OmpH family outer membrane protein [Gammaproteobacteria bacterium]